MGPKVEWIPPVEYLESGNIGAGGMPAFGRLSMWKKYNFDNCGMPLSSFSSACSR